MLASARMTDQPDQTERVPLPPPENPMIFRIKGLATGVTRKILKTRRGELQDLRNKAVRA
jgi:hypothetical protein